MCEMIVGTSFFSCAFWDENFQIKLRCSYCNAIWPLKVVYDYEILNCDDGDKFILCCVCLAEILKNQKDYENGK